MTNLSIEVVELDKCYGQTPVLNAVNLAVARGSVFALLGPNGAGKTTIVRILATLTAADSGRVQVAGYDVMTQRRQVRRRIRLTGQFAALDELLTGSENLHLMGRLLGLSARASKSRSEELLSTFGLETAGGRRVGSYSGGMRRRLDVAAGLVVAPEVMFLDEPTTGLDPRGRQAMWDVVSALAATGVTVFLTTQYLEEADGLADRIAIMDNGRIVAEGTAAELKRHVSGHCLDLDLVDSDAFELAVTCLGSRAKYIDRAAKRIAVATDGSALQIRALLDELDHDRSRISHFTARTASLDDVFMSLTGQRNSLPKTETANV